MSDTGISNLVGKAIGWFASATNSNDSAESKPKEPEYAPNEVIVKFKSEVSVQPHFLSTNLQSINTLFQKHNVLQVNKVFKGQPKQLRHDTRIRMDPLLDLSNIYKLKIPQGKDVKTVIEELKKNQNVEYAEPNYIIHLYDTIPNDPYYSQQWALPKIEAPRAWDLEQGDPNVIVAVIDTGVDYNHPDLTNNIWINEDEIPNNDFDDDGNGYIDDVIGWNFGINDSNNDPIDTEGHGTGVAGIIGATTNNGIGISGLNWFSKIMALKYDLYTSSAAEALHYAADNGAKIINMSWGNYSRSSLQNDAINYAYNRGCILVSATGNDGIDIPSYPAAFKNVIAVSATDENDQRAIWSSIYSSNHGSWIDLSAPGSDNYSTGINNTYELFGGTSGATPHVSAAASLIASMHPNLSNEEVKQLLLKSIDDIGTSGWDKYFGYGRLNLFNALFLPLLGFQPSTAKISSPFVDEIYANNLIDISGSALSDDFSHYSIEYGIGDEPTTWVSNVIDLSNNGLFPINNNLLGMIDAATIGSNYITLKLRTYDNQGNWAEDRAAFYADNLLKPGWPINIGIDLGIPEIIGADIKNDGSSKIALSGHEYLYLLSANGDVLPNWPKSESNFSQLLSPALADIDLDGKLEIVTAGINSELFCNQLDGEGKIFIWDGAGNSVNNWPKSVNFEASCSNFNSPLIVDDINDDGNPEIIVANHDNEKIYIFNSNGNFIPGWPKEIQASSLAIADLDYSGGKKIVFSSGGSIHVSNNDGTDYSGWPQNLPSIELSDPIAADLNHDGSQEIIATGGNSSQDQKTIVVFNSDGTVKNGWPISVNGFRISSVSAGEVDNDGIAEISFATLEYDFNLNKCIRSNVYLYDHEGNPKSGWPKQIENDCSWATPILEDVNGDDFLDIIFVSTFKKVSVWNSDGTSIDNWPRYTRARNFGSMVFDADGNGQKELIVTTKTYSYASGFAARQEIYAWEMPSESAQSPLSWPMWRHDARNTGNYNADVISPGIFHSPMSTVSVNTAIPIPAQITDNVEVRMAKVYYKTTNSPTYEFAQMTNTIGDAWEGEIPASAVTLDGVQYYLVAHDTSINPKINPLGAPEQGVYDVSVYDNLPPSIFHAPITTAYEGEDLNITAQIGDNSGENPATNLFFRICGSPTWQSVSMANMDNNYSAIIPGSYVPLEGLEYYIEAIDSSNNTSTDPTGAPSNVHSVTVLDNTAPTISHTPITTANEGEDLNITAQIEDNSGEVPAAKLFFRTDSSDIWQFISMSNNGSGYSAIIPRDYVTLDGLEYFLEAEDSSGNHSTSPVGAPSSAYSVTVNTQSDTTPPTIIHEPVERTMEGTALLITAEVSDDISGIQEVKLTYWHKEGNEKELLLEKKGENFFAATIPGEDVKPGEMKYHLSAKDKRENETKTQAFTIKVGEIPTSCYGCGCSIGR